MWGVISFITKPDFSQRGNVWFEPRRRKCVSSKVIFAQWMLDIHVLKNCFNLRFFSPKEHLSDLGCLEFGALCFRNWSLCTLPSPGFRDGSNRCVLELTTFPVTWVQYSHYPTRWIVMAPAFYKLGPQGSERVRNLPRAAQLE